MKHAPILLCIASVTVLTACGDGSPFQADEQVPVGTITVADGVYTITQGDREFTLDEDDAVSLQTGQLTWVNDTARAQLYQSDNVLAIGGVDADATPFAGLTGTIGDRPTGDATFSGSYTVITEDNLSSGNLTLNYALDTGAITNDGGDLTVDATMSEVAIDGTVEFDGQSGILEGNFFGDDEIAGAFTGAEIGGIISGTQDE